MNDGMFRTDGQGTDGLIEGRTMDGQTDGRTDRRKDGPYQTMFNNHIHIRIFAFRRPEIKLLKNPPSRPTDGVLDTQTGRKPDRENDGQIE